MLSTEMTREQPPYHPTMSPYQAEDNESLVERIERRNGIHTLEHAEAIRLGSRTYKPVNIDE